MRGKLEVTSRQGRQTTLLFLLSHFPLVIGSVIVIHDSRFWVIDSALATESHVGLWLGLGLAWAPRHRHCCPQSPSCSKGRTVEWSGVPSSPIISNSFPILDYAKLMERTGKLAYVIDNANPFCISMCRLMWLIKT